jgi:hypothetical protein
MKQKKEIIEYSSGEMVTIDEILKDDPKALQELKELRIWMNENPHLFQFPEEKRTQGQKKMKQLLEDARRDQKFVKGLEKIVKDGSECNPKEMYILYTKYRWFLNELQSFRKKHLLRNSTYKLKKSLCKKYGIDPLLFDRLIYAYKNNHLEGWDFSEEASSDVCILESPEDIEQPVDIHSFHLGLVDGIEKDVYPIHIKIHRFATKRDTSDFIEKNWKKISSYLVKKRIRQRKLSREVVDFIWKHKDKKANGIISLLRDKYPNVSLAYFEINKVLSEEKKRRGIK